MTKTEISHYKNFKKLIKLCKENLNVDIKVLSTYQLHPDPSLVWPLLYPIWRRMEVHLDMRQTASCSWIKCLYNKHEPVAKAHIYKLFKKHSWSITKVMTLQKYDLKIWIFADLLHVQCITGHNLLCYVLSFLPLWGSKHLAKHPNTKHSAMLKCKTDNYTINPPTMIIMSKEWRLQTKLNETFCFKNNSTE